MRPSVVNALVTREAPGITIAEDWNALGMRASQSNTTHLDLVAALSDRVFRLLDPGPSRDALIFAIFANFEALISSVYLGSGLSNSRWNPRALAVREKTRLGRDQDPNVR